jgi:hypothetical protein
MEGVLTRKIGWGQLLPFALLYGLAAVTIARMNWRRYSPDEHGWAPGITMALFVSLVFAAGSTMFGEAWIWIAESLQMPISSVPGQRDVYASSGLNGRLLRS